MEFFRKDRPLTPSWEFVRPSLKMLQENIWPVFYLAFLPGLVTLMGVVLLRASLADGWSHVDSQQFGIGVLIALAGSIWTLLTHPGLIILQLRMTRGERPGTMECFRAGLPRLFPYIGTALVGGLLTILGFLFLIIPGLILLRGFYLSKYYVIDQKLGPIESLKKSFEDSRPNAAYIWGTIGVSVVFGMFSSVFESWPVVGYLIALAAGYIYMYGPALRYEEITNVTMKHSKVHKTK